jgi:hypothetical protein
MSRTTRTTITLPTDLHDELRSEAFKYHTSFNQVLVSRLREKPEREYSAKSAEEKIQETFAFFDKIANMGEPIDAVKAVREERDRDEL